MYPAKLNVFQRLTRQWDSLHPYNAAQMMKVADVPDRDTLWRAWRSTISELGLGSVNLRGNRFAWDAVGEGDLVFVEPAEPLNDFITTELNRRFEPGKPLRAFVKESRDGSWLGVAYHHWVADSFSIRLLLREWYLRLFDPPKARRTPLKTTAPGYWHHFGPARGNWDLWASTLQMFRWNAAFRRVRRIERGHAEDLTVHFATHHAPDVTIDRIAGRARELGVTVNDVFLAAAAAVCDRLIPMERAASRPDLALGTIVDLRARAKTRLDDTFGLFLGFTSVFCRPDELKDPSRLLARVHHQNEAQKAAAAAEASMLRIAGGVAASRLLGRRKLLEFYRKRLPLAGGISNVNLNRDWPAQYHPRSLIEYVRVSPAGPMMPVVFTPTTLGRSLNIGLTCRSSIVSPSQGRALAVAFIEQLQQFAETPQQPVAKPADGGTK